MKPLLCPPLKPRTALPPAVLAYDKERLRETQAINKSLATLGTVFSAIGTGATHVPFRDSKLTFFLQVRRLLPQR